MKDSSNRILTFAIAASLAIHFIVAFTVRNVRPIEAKPEPTPAVMHFIVIHTPSPATPAPKPPVTTHATRTSARTPRPALVATTNRNVPGPVEQLPSGPASTAAPDDGGGIGTSGPDATPAPPVATPKPSCAVPNAPATALDVVEAQSPDGAPGATGTAKVQVTLSETGAVEDAKIFASAGNMLLDRAAVKAARQSTYRPEIVDCVPTGGSYLFTVTFQE